MAVLDPVLNGDTGLEARTKINGNDTLINDELGALSLSIKNGTTGTLGSGSRTVTFAAPFADSNYTLILNVRDASGISSTYILTAKIAASFTVTLDFSSIIDWIAIAH